MPRLRVKVANAQPPTNRQLDYTIKLFAIMWAVTILGRESRDLEIILGKRAFAKCTLCCRCCCCSYCYRDPVYFVLFLKTLNIFPWHPSLCTVVAGSKSQKERGETGGHSSLVVWWMQLCLCLFLHRIPFFFSFHFIWLFSNILTVIIRVPSSWEVAAGSSRNRGSCLQSAAWICWSCAL